MDEVWRWQVNQIEALGLVAVSSACLLFSNRFFEWGMQNVDPPFDMRWLMHHAVLGEEQS